MSRRIGAGFGLVATLYMLVAFCHKYVRNVGILKMTGATARTFKLGDIGLLTEGYRADIAVFDPARVQAHATYENVLLRRLRR